MKKRIRGPLGAVESDGQDSEAVLPALSLSSDSDNASDSEVSDLPEETDSEAGLPSDDPESDIEDGQEEDASSGQDELDQAFLDVLHKPESGTNDNGAKEPQRYKDGAW